MNRMNPENSENFNLDQLYSDHNAPNLLLKCDSSDFWQIDWFW